MDEYIAQAIDILTGHYTDMCVGSGNYTYSDEQVMWALEIAINFMTEKTGGLIFMITASEAKHRVKAQTLAKEHLGVIEKHITDAVSRNRMSTMVVFNQPLDEEMLEIIGRELINLGYNFKYESAEDLPPGCPPDQWHSENHLIVDWI